jgi:polyhydroxyalkanoate synthesis regulator phasin
MNKQVIIFADTHAKFLDKQFMSNPLVHTFFVGRALAEALGEQLEMAFTDLMSEVGKFDAEQRESLRQFTEEVMERAHRAEAAAMQGRPAASAPSTRTQPDDLQAMIDDLRAEIAQLRTELQRYRNRSV